MLVHLTVYAAVNAEGLDVGAKIRKEICAEPGLLVLLKVITFDQILDRLIKNLYFHTIRSDMRCPAVCQSMKRALPA